MIRAITTILLSLPVLHAQDFVNLNFDNPDLTGSLTPINPQFPNGPFWGEAARLLPGWNFTANGQPAAEASFTPFGAPGASERTINLREAPSAEWPTLAGRYYLLVNSGSFPAGPEFRLSQTAILPADVAGIHIFAPGLRDMRINGEPVTDPRLGFLADPVIDLTAYAGREAKIEFVFAPGWSGRFDVFGFTQIPEPSTWALFGVGAGGLFWAASRRRKS